MSFNWGGYEFYDPQVSGPLYTLPRAEARRAFNRLMDAKQARIEQLRRLLEASGVLLNASDEAIQDMNDWFVSNLEPDPDNPGWPRPEWFSVVYDIALFLGDVMIERHPNLHWEFFTWGKKNEAYQQHVIMGLAADPKFKTNINIGAMVAAYAYRIVASKGSYLTYGREVVRGIEIDVDRIMMRHGNDEVKRDAFVRWLQTAARLAP